jgi:hypothetical protein
MNPVIAKWRPDLTPSLLYEKKRADLQEVQSSVEWMLAKGTPS